MQKRNKGEPITLSFWFYIRSIIENRSFLFVTFLYGVEHEAVGTADAYALILEHLPFVDFPEEPAEVVVIAVWKNHRIDKPEFTPIDKTRIIAIVIHATAIFILWAREDEIVTAKFAICRMKNLC